jgi:multiple sugar transport system substrate-binding protein
MMRWHPLSDWGEYPRRIAALHASGQLGDLVESPPGPLLARWASKRITRSIDDIVAADRLDTSGIFRSAMRFSLYQGRQVGLPFLCHAGENVLLFHKGLFDEAGLPYPNTDWTLEDMSKAAMRLTRDENGDGVTDRFGYALRPGLPGAYPMLSLFGAQLFSQDGRTCLINSENGIACLRWAQEQVRVRKIAPSPVQVERGSLEMLLEGRLAMLRHAFRTLVDLRRTGESEIGGTLLPKHPATGKIGTLASGMVYCISQNSRAPSEAFQWIKFMSSREMGVQMFLGGYADPGCRMASWKDARILEPFPLCAQIAAVADTAEIECLPANLRVGECLAAWNRAITPLLFGEVSPEECARQIDGDISAILALPQDEGDGVLPDTP